MTVDDHVVVFAPRRDLVDGAREAPADLARSVRLPLLEPGLEFPHRRGHHEHVEALGIARAELPGALRVDVEQDVLAPVEHGLERPGRRAVEVAVNARPLGELPAVDHLLEARLGDEVVRLSLDLAGPRAARRVGHGVGEVRHGLADLPTEGGLSGPRRSRNDDEHAPARRCGSHSTFCTCSRMRSTRVRASRTRATNSASSAFDAMVFTSRCSSWARKSSWRPTAPPAPIRVRNCARWELSRASSSATSLRAAHVATSWVRRPGSAGVSPRMAWTRSRRRAWIRARAAGSNPSTPRTHAPSAST